MLPSLHIFNDSASAQRSPSSVAQLNKLAELWRKENRAEKKRYLDETSRLTLEERVQRGRALRDLRIVDEDASLGGRALLWLVPANQRELEGFHGSPGTPVRLWLNDPGSDQAVLGTVSRLDNDRIGIVVDDIPEFLEEGGFQLDIGEPKSITFERGKNAIQKFSEAGPGTSLHTMREVLYGNEPMTFNSKMDAAKPLQPFDDSTNEPQWEAITHALSTDNVALIHGPPGTGKTRALIEVIRQAVAQGKRVLATAASNAAVDNLVERLAATGPPPGLEEKRKLAGLDPQNLEVVRLGHPARISDETKAYSLDARIERTTEYKQSRKFVIEANALRQKIAKLRARNEVSPDEEQQLQQEKHELYQEMRNLLKDARSNVQFAQEQILGRAEVVCTTAAGADSKIMGDLHFDLVVLDEATQVPDPVALVALARGSKVIMAGDPCQLPPTVIDPEAASAGLGVTFFERLAEQDQDALRMLTVQYRMNNAIMAFPSGTMYDGRLTAAPEVAQHQLHEIDGVASDPLRDAPFLFLDTSGKGWEENRTRKDKSTYNRLQAERTTAEVLRLVSRGLHPSDIAVITPYNAQARLLRSLLSEQCAEGLEIDSVDGFQGREKEAIVYDLVRSNEDGKLGFVNDMRRMNVALTRARRFLMVIGDSATLGTSQDITALLKHAEREDVYLSAWDDDAPSFEGR
jgi:predicted DNA helicase